MKIIREGDITGLEQSRRFECEACGCAFIATASEYSRREGYRNAVQLVIRCPCCGKTLSMEE